MYKEGDRVFVIVRPNIIKEETIVAVSKSTGLYLLGDGFRQVSAIFSSYQDALNALEGMVALQKRRLDASLEVARTSAFARMAARKGIELKPPEDVQDRIDALTGKPAL